MDKGTDSQQLGCPTTVSSVSSSEVPRTCSCHVTESSRLEETSLRDKTTQSSICGTLKTTQSSICGMLAHLRMSKVFRQEDPDLGGRYRAEDLISLYLGHLIHKAEIIMLANLRRL